MSDYWNRRSISRRRLMRGAALGGAGLAGAALIGCGSDDETTSASSSGASSASSSSSSSSSAATAAATQQVVATSVATTSATDSGIKMGGTLKAGTNSTPNFVRMPFNTAGNNTYMNQNSRIFDRLVEVGQMRGKRQLARDQKAPLYELYDADFSVYPSLAQSWEVTDGGTTVIFKLIDKDVQFHDGKPMTAADVKASYELMMAGEHEGVVGSPYNLMSANFTSVETPDDKTVVVKLSKPTGYMYDFFRGANIGDMNTLEQVKEGVLNGTGPFKFGNYDPNVGYELTKNADYWGDTGPYLDKIETTIFADSGAQGLAFEAGDIDLFTGGTLLPEHAEAIADNGDWEHETYGGMGGRVFRVRADILDKRVRQGLMLLLQQDRIQKEYFGEFDQGGRLQFQPSSIAFVPELDAVAYNPAEAAKLISAAGGVEGNVLKADVLPERLDAPATAQMIQQDLAQMGIELQINNREYSEMISLQTTGTFEHMLIGFGNWIKQGSPALTVLYADSYDGRMNAPVGDGSVALRDRPGVKDELEWMDMIEKAKDGEVEDWEAWNKKFLDVAWSNCVVRTNGNRFRSPNVAWNGGYDADAWGYLKWASKS